jgi:uncharacterized protein YutD
MSSLQDKINQSLGIRETKKFTPINEAEVETELLELFKGSALNNENIKQRLMEIHEQLSYAVFVGNQGLKSRLLSQFLNKLERVDLEEVYTGLVEYLKQHTEFDLNILDLLWSGNQGEIID